MGHKAEARIVSHPVLEGNVGEGRRVNGVDEPEEQEGAPVRQSNLCTQVLGKFLCAQDEGQNFDQNSDGDGS